MSFQSITARIMAILEDRKPDLVDGLLDRKVALEAAYWRPHLSPQAVFVWRDSLRDIQHGQISGHGTGAGAHGEIEGRASWVIAPYLRFTGAEETAAEQLSLMAWNLLTIMAGYTTDTGNAYMGCLFEGSAVNYRQSGSEGGWYVGEEFKYSVSWDLTF